MKWKTFLVASAVVAASLAAAPSASLAAAISIDPATTPVATGDTFTVEVLLTGGVNVNSYQLSVQYDPSALLLTNFQDGTFLDFFDPTPPDDGGFVIPTSPDLSTPGLIVDFAAFLFNTTKGVTGDGVLATLEFKALKAGTTAVTPFFGIGNGLFDWNDQPIETALNSGEVTARGDSVPEPVSVLTLTLGLGTLLARRRRQARPAATR